MTRRQTTHAKPPAGRAATAPYNFVRLPQQVLSATTLVPPGSRPWRSHDRYLPGLHTGHLDVDITTLTPLFIGPAVLSTDGAAWTTPQRGQAQRSFRLTPDGPPVLPGSSITGLLDTVVRILSFSRPDLIWDPRLWMRQPVVVDKQPATKRRSRSYAQLRADDPKLAKVSRSAGFLRRETKDGASRWYVEPLDTPGHAPLKVRHPLLPELFNGKEWQPPRDDIDYRPGKDNAAWFQREVYYLTCELVANGKDRSPRQGVVIGVAPTDDHAACRKIDQRYRDATKMVGNLPENPPRWLVDSVPDTSRVTNLKRVHTPQLGMLVLTGTTGTPRASEYIFPLTKTSGPGKRLDVDGKFAKEVDLDSQITQWQREVFPAGGSRPGDGRFAAGDPVWFEVSRPDGKGKPIVTSFGRAGGYRVPYTHTLGSLLPAHLRQPAALDEPDVCQGLFGDVHRGDAIRRRVSVGHATLLTPHDDACELDPVRLELFAPNRQSYALYLTQRTPEDVMHVRDYGSTRGEEPDTEPRGFKLYPHHDLVSLPEPAGDIQEYQADIVPLRPDLVFRCRIRFTNLSRLEIGLLLRALLLDNQPGGPGVDPLRAHKLGRGKPLGLGSVHMNPTLHLLDPAARYRGESDGYHRVDDLAPYLSEWDQAACEHADRSGEETLPDRTDWQSVARFRELALACAWRHRLDAEHFRQMGTDEFAEDRVLPGILHLPFPKKA